MGTSNLAGKVFVTSGLGGMSGAQAKAAVICGCVGVVAEVRCAMCSLVRLDSPHDRSVMPNFLIISPFLVFSFSKCCIYHIHSNCMLHRKQFLINGHNVYVAQWVERSLVSSCFRVLFLHVSPLILVIVTWHCCWLPPWGLQGGIHPQWFMLVVNIDQIVW